MISKKMAAALESGICIRDIFEEGKKLAAVYGAENIFNFTIGNPSIEPPEIVTKALIKHAQTKPGLAVHGYPANVGFQDVRECIAKYLNDTYGTNYDYRGITMTV